MNISDLPEHKVVVAPSSHRGVKVYHTQDCGRFPENPSTMDRTMADAWGFKHCSYCQEDNPNSKKGRKVDRSYQDALKEAAQND